MELIPLNNDGSSNDVVVEIFTKLSIYSNILPYFGYYEDWEVLYQKLSGLGAKYHW